MSLAIDSPDHQRAMASLVVDRGAKAAVQLKKGKSPNHYYAFCVTMHHSYVFLRHTLEVILTSLVRGRIINSDVSATSKVAALRGLTVMLSGKFDLREVGTTRQSLTTKGSVLEQTSPS